MKNDRLLLLAFFLSGTAALGYEILWTRLLSLALGSETLGILGVLAGFFGGLAIGSWLLHDAARRARNPLRLFAILETVAALYAALSPFLLYALARRLPAWLGPAAGDNDTTLALVLALGVATLVLLPATLCMGATLAALVEARRRALPEDDDGHGLGRLYAVNTAGATCGVLATVFWILPTLGMVGSAILLAALGLGAAGLAIVWGRRAERSEAPRADDRAAGSAARWAYPFLALTGFAAVGLEVAGVHILAQILEDTVYTFAGALAMYLIGNAAGAALYATLLPFLKRFEARKTTALLLFLQTVSIALAAIYLRLSPGVLEQLAPPGSSYTRHLVSELVIAGWVFLTPTLVMGALFSHIVAQLASRGVGRAYALNTLGGTIAPFVFGLVALRGLGYAAAFYSAAAIYGALLLYTVLAGWISRGRGFAAVAAAAVMLLIAPPSLVLIEVEPGWEVVAEEPSLYGLVRVTQPARGPRSGQGPDMPTDRRLQINRHFRMGGSLSFGEQRMGHLPLLLKPDARSVLFLGVGTGATLSAVRHYPLERVEAVEIVPEVLDLLPLFEHVNEGVADDPAIRFHAADARRYAAASRQRYDLIVGDLFHPARDGAGTLYSLQHFQTLADRLEDGGLLVQWLPLYQFDEANLKTVLRTFLEVFPDVHTMLGIYNVATPALALIGALEEGDLRLDLEHLETRLEKPVYERLLMRDLRDTLASYMLDRQALERFAGEGPINTDLTPTVLFEAPKSAYEKRPDLQWGNLVALLPHRRLFPEGWVESEDPRRAVALRQQTEAFSRALTFYLQGEVLRAEAPGGPPPDEALELYLRAFETAPEFTAVQAILWAVARRDPTRAETIFERVLARDPDNRRAHYERLGHLESIGDRDRFQSALQQARALFGAEAFPDPGQGSPVG